jgi:hypothetical protein
MRILDITSRVLLPSLVIMPLKYLKYLTFSSCFIFFTYPRKIILIYLDEGQECVLQECLRYEDWAISFWERHFRGITLNLLCVIFKARVLWRPQVVTIANGKAHFLIYFILSDYVRHSGDKAFGTELFFKIRLIYRQFY